MSREKEMLAHAAALIEAGWSVLPCKTNGKAPLTKNGVKDATLDIEKVKAWLRRHPNANLGAEPPDGFFVLDVDVGNGKHGDRHLANLSAAHGALVEAPEQCSGGGGRHLVFAVPPGRSGPPSQPRGMDIDVKGRGGYIIVGPSIHASGGKYAWKDISVRELAARLKAAPVAPDWLYTLRKHPSPAAETVTPLDYATGQLGWPRTEVARMLGALPPDEWRDTYKGWLDVGMALHHEYGGDTRGLALWIDFSQAGPSFDLNVLEEKWSSFRPRQDPIRLASILMAAKEHGFEPRADKDGPSSQPTAASISATLLQLGNPRDLPRRAFVSGDYLIRKAVTATVAPGGRGKSTLGIAEDIGIASGKDTIYPAPKSPCVVWHINLEESREELMLRVHAAAQHYGITNNELGSRLYVDSADDIGNLVTVRQMSKGGYMVQPVVADMIKEMRRKRVDVLRIDPFILTHAVDENQNTAIALVLNEFKRIARETNAAVHLVAHTRKASANKTEFDAEDTRGGKAIVDLSRKVRVLNKMSDADAAKYGISKESSWAYVRIDDAKQNFAPPGDHARWFKLESVTLPNGPDEDWKEGDKVGVAIAWTPTRVVTAISEEEREKILRFLLGSDGWRHDIRAAQWVGKGIAAALGLDPATDRERVKGSIETGMREGWLIVETAKDKHFDDRMFVRPRRLKQSLKLVSVNGEQRTGDDILGFDLQSALPRTSVK